MASWLCLGPGGGTVRWLTPATPPQGVAPSPGRWGCRGGGGGVEVEDTQPGRGSPLKTGGQHSVTSCRWRAISLCGEHLHSSKHPNHAFFPLFFPRQHPPPQRAAAWAGSEPDQPGSRRSLGSTGKGRKDEECPSTAASQSPSAPPPTPGTSPRREGPALPAHPRANCSCLRARFWASRQVL